MPTRPLSASCSRPLAKTPECRSTPCNGLIQGAAGSTILACGLSLLSVANTCREQLRAVSLWGPAAAVGAAAGPLVGGVLVDITGWQGLFWIDAGVAVLCMVLTSMSGQASPEPVEERVADRLSTRHPGARSAVVSVLRGLGRLDRAAYRAVPEMSTPLLDGPLRRVSGIR
jgi:MFS family permease